MPDDGNTPAPGPADVPGYVMNGAVMDSLSELQHFGRFPAPVAQRTLQHESSHYGGGGNPSGMHHGKSKRSLVGAMQEGRAAARQNAQR